MIEIWKNDIIVESFELKPTKLGGKTVEEYTLINPKNFPITITKCESLDEDVKIIQYPNVLHAHQSGILKIESAPKKDRDIPLKSLVSFEFMF